MNILATITQPSNGRICWQGVDIAKEPDVLRRVLGYLPQDFGIYPHLNAVMGLYADIFSQKGFSISDFHYVGGELMAEAILDRSMMLDGATLAATTYLVLVHNP